MSKSSRNRKNTNALILLAGVAVGAGAAYFLNTPKGKEMTNNALNKGKELKSSMAEKALSISENAKETASKVIENATKSIENAKETLVNKTENILNQVESEENSFDKGIEKAKTALNSNVA